MEGIRKIVRVTLGIMFAIYCFMVIYVCFFSRERGTEISIFEYFTKNSNVIPFNTIKKYVRLLFDGHIRLAWTNVFGNFVLLFPLGVLLPCVAKGVNRWWKMAILGFLAVVGIELMQFFLQVGVIDVDDIILKVIGAMLGYGLIRIPLVYETLCKIGAIDNEEDLENEES